MRSTQVCSYFVACLPDCLHGLENSLHINFLCFSSWSVCMSCAAEWGATFYTLSAILVKYRNLFNDVVVVRLPVCLFYFCLFVYWFYLAGTVTLDIGAEFRITADKATRNNEYSTENYLLKKCPWLLVLVDFPHLLLYHYSLCASSCTILSSVYESRNHIITIQPATYPLYIFTVTLGTLFPSRSLLASAVQQLSTSKWGRFSTT